MTVSSLHRAFVSLATFVALASCTSNAASNVQQWVFCMPDGWTFTVDDAAQRVRWADVEFAYGPTCTGRCLEGFEAVATALHKGRKGEATFGKWQTHVGRDDGIEEHYNFSIRAESPRDLVVGSQVYSRASRLFGCTFDGRI